MILEHLKLFWRLNYSCNSVILALLEESNHTSSWFIWGNTSFIRTIDCSSTQTTACILILAHFTIPTNSKLFHKLLYPNSSLEPRLQNPESILCLPCLILLNHQSPDSKTLHALLTSPLSETAKILLKIYSPLIKV